MATREHHYQVCIEWTGNDGQGTATYKSYRRDYRVTSGNKPEIHGSSDPAFLGDAARWNPEDMLLASTAACHKLWYLHLCAEAGIVVVAYHDNAEGTMVEGDQGRFTKITLQPHVSIRHGDDRQLALELHHQAHQRCYIANSLNFPVLCEATIDWATA